MDGIALHWYSDDWTGPSVMDETQAMFPDKFLLYTESCDGKVPFVLIVQSWETL